MSETAFCDSAGPTPPRASHMTRYGDSALVTHARALHLVTLLDKRLAGWSVCPIVPQNPVRMTRRMTSNRQDDRIHGHPGDRSSISCHSAPALAPCHDGEAAQEGGVGGDGVDGDRPHAQVGHAARRQAVLDVVPPHQEPACVCA